MLKIIIALIYIPIVCRVSYSLLLDFSMKIRTMGYMKPTLKGFNRTESTPYSAIKCIANNWDLSENDSIVDFGCGKGRFMLGINYFKKVDVIGIEGSDKAFVKLSENIKSYKKRTGNENVNAVLGYAQEYKFSEKDNKFFFFNPFDVVTFEEVLNNIVEHSNKVDKQVEIALYAPSKELYEHINSTEFKLKKKIPHYGKMFPSENIYIYEYKKER